MGCVGVGGGYYYILLYPSRVWSGEAAFFARFFLLSADWPARERPQGLGLLTLVPLEPLV